MPRAALRLDRRPVRQAGPVVVLFLTLGCLLPLRSAAVPPGIADHAGTAVPQGERPPAVVSPEVRPDRSVVFRIRAPRATEVRLVGSDIPGSGRGTAMVRGDGDVWELALGPLGSGAYRYNFNVDGLSVIDPRNPTVSESNNNVWSLVYVPGSSFMDLQEVPHGAVAEVPYYSQSLGTFRRLHVYTPPGYESGRDRYPVFYLLHGAGDCDDSWSTVGRAGFILDNMIAAGTAQPMVVVMPSGHIRPWESAPQAATQATGEPTRPPADAFEQDFLTDIMPFIEQHYRVYTDQRHRAIAGLSMGGSQTLNIVFTDLRQFGYVGVFSSGLIGSFGRRRAGGGAEETGPTWEERHAAALEDPGLREGIRLIWFATGRDDFLIDTSRGTVELLRKHGFEVDFRESEGGHTWINWRDYLHAFAPELFR